MKALIVDDDRITVEVILHSIAWKELEIDRVLTAYDGLQARGVVEKEKPDIVLCDIEMPLSTGLDFLRWMKAEKYSAKFIFLTCHENFDFAREALVLGANDYILKPLHSSRITGALLKAVREIRVEQNLKADSLQIMGRAQNELARNFFRELMERSIPKDAKAIEEELHSRKMELDAYGSYRLVLSCIQDLGIAEEEWDERSFHYAFKQLFVEAVLERLDYPYLVDWGRNGYFYCMLIVQADKVSEGKLEEQSKLFVDICGQYLRVVPSCYIGIPIRLTEFADSVPKLLNMAEEARLQRGKVRLQGQMQELRESGSGKIDSRLIMDCLEKRDRLSVNRYLKKMLELLKEEDRLTPRVMHSIYQDIMQCFYVWLLDREVEAHRLFMGVDARQLYENAEKSVVDLIKWVNFLFDASIDQVEKMKQTSTLVMKAKEYVKYHYMENIGRDEIATSIFVTPNYLSKIFHEETGIVLKEYINQVRIDAAKNCLRNTDHSIAYVAMETGFENVSYFSTVFKKMCGMTPKDYRNGNRRGEQS